MIPLSDLAPRIDAMMCQCGHELGWHVGTNGVGLGSGPACHCGCDHFVRAVESGLGEETRAVGVPEVAIEPEITIESGQGKYGAGLWHVRVNGKSVSVYEAKDNAENACKTIRSAFKAAGMPRPSAAGEVAAASPLMVPESDDRGKWFVKARVYGAIAREYQKALQAFADRGEALAQAALDWRHSELGGVPRSAVDEIDALLKGAAGEVDRIALTMEVTRVREERDHYRELYFDWRREALENERICNAALAAGLAQCEKHRATIDALSKPRGDELMRAVGVVAASLDARLTAAVAAARAEEREACARECDELQRSHFGDADHAWSVLECARRIRARGAQQTSGTDTLSILDSGHHGVTSRAAEGSESRATIFKTSKERTSCADTSPERSADDADPAPADRGDPSARAVPVMSATGARTPGLLGSNTARAGGERPAPTPAASPRWGVWCSTTAKWVRDTRDAFQGEPWFGDERDAVAFATQCNDGESARRAGYCYVAKPYDDINRACPRCGGKRYLFAPGADVNDDVRCPDCNGTGRALATAPPALTGAQLAERHGFEPHGRAPLTGGVRRDALGVPLGTGRAPAAAPPGEVGDSLVTYVGPYDGEECADIGSAEFGRERVGLLCSTQGAAEYAVASLRRILVNALRAERARARREALEAAAQACRAWADAVRHRFGEQALAAERCEQRIRALAGETKE